jgi:hypothetical protein
MPTEKIASEVPPEEVARRIAEYRHIAFEHRVSPQMVYKGTMQLCPWPDCGYRIAGIRFNLERMGDAAFYEDALAAFWQGPGVVARCPGCRRYVRFGYEEKHVVEQPLPGRDVMLPDNWDEIAYLVPANQRREES